MIDANNREILKYLLKGKKFIALCLALICFSQTINGQITGRVIDSNGEPLIGVNVIEKDTSNGTTTDIDGNYSLNASPENTLIFSYIGFSDLEVPINNQTLINVTLEDGVALDEVVVTGYGVQRKVDVTGAVGSIGVEEISRVPILSADQALRGRLSGVQLTNRSGDPGAPISVRIRGVGTLGNNQPLYIVDGVPIVQTTNITVNTASNTESNPLVGINPSDIESIDVLKDASAAAIYGTRASNGVVIITTKRGKEGRTSLTYNGYIGVQNVRKTHEVLGVADYIALQSELGRDFSDFSGSPDVNWQDEVFAPAAMQSHSLTASGGTETATFSVSGGYFNQDGITLASGFKRYNVKANSDIKVGKRIKVGESLNISFSDRLVESEPGRFAASRAAENSPFTPVYDANGDYTVFDMDNSGQAAGNNQQVVGLNDLENNETRVLSRRILGSVFGEVEIIEGLKFKTIFGADYNIGQGGWFKNIYDFAGREGTQSDIQQVVSKPTELTTNITNTLTYNTSFGNNINLTLLVGHEETNFEFDRLRGQGTGFLNDGVTLVNTANISAVGQEKDIWALRGYLGRVNLDFDRNLLLTASLRRDESSRFAPENRSAIFPSFSVGYRLSELPFFAGNGVVEELKLRAGWGQAGNQFTSSSFGYLPTLGLTTYYVLGADQTVIQAPVPFTFSNKDLTWETATSTNVGLDFRLLAGKVEGSFDFFQKNTTDILVGLPISAISGFLLPPDVNQGEVRNRGFEISALYQNRIGDFNYNISGNLTSVKNEVISLGESGTAIISGFFGAQTHRTAVGFPVGSFYGYQTDGIYQTQAEADAALPDELSSGAAAGDVKFVDVNGDGEINADDRTFLGNSSPDLFYGLNLGGDFKNIDLSIFIQGVSGVNVFNNVGRTLRTMTGVSNQHVDVLDRWTPSNTGADVPRATLDDTNQNNRFSDRWVEKANYLRLQNVQIGYTIGKQTLQGRLDDFIQNLRIYVAASNLITLTPYSGLDPEVTRGFSFQKGEQPLATGQDDGSTPSPTVIQFGVSATF